MGMLMCGEIGQEMNKSAEKLNEVMMKVVTLVMDFAPIGVFFLIAKTFSEQGFGLIVPMLGYFSVVIVCLLLHTFGTLSLLLALFAKLSPIIFIKKCALCMFLPLVLPVPMPPSRSPCKWLKNV